MFEQIAKEWSEHEVIPFPDGFTGIIEGVNLFVLDAEIGAVISAFVASGGSLASYRIKRLEGLLNELKPVIPLLNETGRGYFEALVRMGSAILKGLRAPTDEIHFRVKKSE